MTRSARAAPTRRRPRRRQHSSAPRLPATPPPRWRRRLVLGLGWLGLLAICGLWVAHHGVQDLAGGAGGLTSLGRLTGLVASALLLVQVLLMARIPWVEQGFGQDTLARWHRLVGFTSFDLLVAHIVLVTVGYALSGHTGVVGQFVDLVLDYPGMLLALAGTLLLVGVVALSVRAARRRLRYESWHLLHLYAYLGAGLALPHQIWTGTDFASSARVRDAWWAAYGLTMACVLAFRVVRPMWRTLHHRVKVTEVVDEGPGVVSVHLTGHRLDRLRARAGHFFVWRFLDGEGWMRGHPYSLSAAPRRRALRITVKALGDDSADLARLRPGTRVAFEGPYGSLTGQRRSGRKVTMVAAGIGITPLRALLEEMDYAPGDAVLLYRATTEDDLVLREEIERLAEERGVRVVYLTGRRSRRASWLPAGAPPRYDATALRTYVPDIAEHDVFVCGPDSWMDAVRQAAQGAGADPERIHLERFAW